MQKHISVSVVGSGVVGQATGRGFLSHGVDVTFIDINSDKIERLRSEGLKALTASEVQDTPLTSDITVFTVPTPTERGKINLEYLYAAARDFGRRLKMTDSYHVAVVRSTVVPGTTESLIEIIETESGKKVGEDFGLGMNPEYLREKTAVEDFHNPWLIVIGEYDKKSGEMMARMYQEFDCPIQHVSIKEAETQKYIHNLYNAVKITFFNEFRQICKKMNVEADAIFPLVAKSCEGMWNAEYGIKDFGPFDGMCLPKDTQAFLDWARSQGWDMPLLATSINVNNELAKQDYQIQSPVLLEAVQTQAVETNRESV